MFYLDGLAISHVLHNPEPLLYPNPEIFTLALPPLLRTLFSVGVSHELPGKGRWEPGLIGGSRCSGYLHHSSCSLCFRVFLSLGYGILSSYLFPFLDLGLTPSPSGPLCSIQMRKKEDLYPQLNLSEKNSGSFMAICLQIPFPAFFHTFCISQFSHCYTEPLKTG
uniref:Uncharacterized protein n=1 Tax=Piliocolobus tephrosceles TaxID=591936 RepID=A0A8C9IUS4_9PRIM